MYDYLNGGSQIDRVRTIFFYLHKAQTHAKLTSDVINLDGGKREEAGSNWKMAPGDIVNFKDTDIDKLFESPDGRRMRSKTDI